MAHPAGRPALLLARGLLALTATEIAVTALVVGSAAWLAGAWPAVAPPLAWALGAGAAAGVTWAAAEGLARRGRVGLALGLLTLALAAPAVARAGDYAALRLESATSLEALRALLALGAPHPVEALLAASAALCLGGPALALRAGGARLAAQVAAALAGTAAWLAGAAHAPAVLDATHVTPYLLLVVPRATLLPLLLALADRLGRETRPVEVPAAAPAEGPAAAHRAAWLVGAADEGARPQRRRAGGGARGPGGPRAPPRPRAGARGGAGASPPGGSSRAPPTCATRASRPTTRRSTTRASRRCGPSPTCGPGPRRPRRSDGRPRRSWARRRSWPSPAPSRRSTSSPRRRPRSSGGGP
ncbi:MAG: hypothetical protein M9894_25340 [Planctomycetes bacterium]|nr:hypothetical protein [Planctomycetota bacterium]